MSRSPIVRIALVLLATFAFACASTPPWGNMTQDQIAAWKTAGFDSAEAQAWTKKGFDPKSAGAWKSQGFDLEATEAWKKEDFTAIEAKRWKTAGFTISEAAANRGKGLTPIGEPAAKAEGEAAEAPATDSTSDAGSK